MSPARDPSGWVHGDTVLDGIIRYLSVSQLNTASSCLRKWHFEKVGLLKADGTEATGLGTEMHAQIEEFLKTGNRKVLGPIANAGFHLIPEPGDELYIEKDMLTRLHETLEVTAENSQFLLDNAILHAAGVPVLGFIDVVNMRGTNKGGSENENVRDPEGTVEVLDWKSTSDFKWAKKGKNLIHTAQMSGYGKWILNQLPEIKYIRLSHAYFLTKGMPRAKKETALFTREQIETAWEHWEGVARLMVEAAKKHGPGQSNQVQLNTDACNDYGGCHLLPRKEGPCSAGMDIGVSAVLGITQARKFAERNAQKGNEKVIPMGSLLSKVNKKKEEEPKEILDAETLLEAKARLKAEEEAATIKARIPAEFPKTWAAIKALHVGTPALRGKMAQALFATLGTLSNATVEGTESFAKGGDFDHLLIEDMDTLTAVLEELSTSVDKGVSDEEESASPLPPDAPESNPSLAYKEAAVEEGLPVTEEVAVPTPAPKKEQAVSKVVAAAGPKEKKVKTAPPLVAAITVDKTMVEEMIKEHVAGVGTIRLYIDCIPSIPYEDLYTWCNKLVDDIALNLPSVDKNGNIVDNIDIRSSINKALDFGKWEGTLSSIARSEEHAPLKPGVYYIETKGSRLRAVIADSLKERADKSGGYYVRG